MTTPEVVSLMGAATALIVAIGSSFASIVVALRTGKKIDENTALTAEVGQKADIRGAKLNELAEKLTQEGTK